MNENPVKYKTCPRCKAYLPITEFRFKNISKNIRYKGETKVINLAAASRMTRPKILEEIAKCDVVCSNCHRERTYKRRAKK